MEGQRRREERRGGEGNEEKRNGNLRKYGKKRKGFRKKRNEENWKDILCLSPQ